MEKRWYKEATVYQIYPRSFYDTNNDGIGDLNGIVEKLDYIKGLGIDVIWLCPIYKSPNDDNGYDVSDYRDIMNEFGTFKDWENLLEQTHKRGMKLIMDLVVNHTSDEHEWFKNAKESKDSPYRDYYIWREGKNDKPPNKWRSEFGFSAWKYDDATKQYYLHLFTKKQPDLNWENKKVREEVYDLMKFWLDRGVDGFRMDVINFIGKPKNLETGEKEYKPNYEATHEYLQEMHREVLSKYDIMTVGETPGVTPEIASKFTSSKRKELNMVFQFEHTTTKKSDDGSKWTDQKADMCKIKRVLSKWQTELIDDGWNSLFFDNHDRPRRVSDLGDDSDKYREISAKMLATMTFMLKGTPYVYQGEEIGMTNVEFDEFEDYKDVEIINAVKERAQQKGITMKESFNELKSSIYAQGRDNARTPMQWDASQNAGFTKSKPWIKVNPNYTKINVSNNIKNKDSVYNYYKKLIKLRKENEVIVYGDFNELLKDNKDGYFYTRELKDEKIIVLINFKREDIAVKLEEFSIPKEAKIIINNYNNSPKLKEMMELKPYQSLVYLIKK